MRLARAFIPFVALACMGVAPTGATSAGLERELLEQAPPAWQRYLAGIDALQGRYTYAMTLEETKLQRTIEYKANGKSKLLSTSYWRTKKGKMDVEGETALGLNRDYGFSLRRKPGAAGWLVSALWDAKAPSAASDFEKSLKEFKDNTSVLVWVFNVPLSDFVKHPGLSIQQCRRIPENGFVEVTFETAQPIGERGIRSGTFVLDPGRLWIVRSYEVHTAAGQNRISMTYEVTELTETKDGMPLPRMAVGSGVTDSADGTHTEHQWRYEYDLRIPETPPPDRDFTLAAFNVPEPLGVASTRGSMPLYVWASALGILCLVLGLLLRLRRSRSAPAATT